MLVEWVVIAVVVAIVLAAIRAYNRLVRLRNEVREGWSGIDVQLKRRADLVPNLVAAVRGYAAHERAVFDEVTAQRGAVLAAKDAGAAGAANAGLTGALGKLMAVAEAYPDLKASANFRALQDELTQVESDLQAARRYYNGTVRDLNSAIQTFPDVMIARPLGFTEAPFFALDDRAEAAAPRVNFGGATP
jgi:LemA protein